MVKTPAGIALGFLEPVLRIVIYAVLIMVGLQLLGFDAFGIVFGWIESLVIDQIGGSLVDWVDGVVPW
jgi:hypothetical protein